MRPKQSGYSRSPEEDRHHHHQMMMMMAVNGKHQLTGTMKSSYNGGGSMNMVRRNTGPSSMMRQSTSVGHLSSFDDGGSGSMHGKKIKRTKSMWKFKKGGGGDEVLTGMSLWKHRSLVDVNAAEGDEFQQQNSFNNKSSAGTPVANKKFTITCRDIDIASNGGGFVADDDDSQTIMNGSSTVRRTTYDNQRAGKQQLHRNGERSRRSSTSSFDGEDSESCIVVDDHSKDTSKRTGTKSGAHHSAPQPQPPPPPPPASLLPRTRLIKQNSTAASAGNSAPVGPPPPPPAVRTATADDSYQHDSDVDIRFESSKLQTFKYINATNNDSWYDSWGEKRKK